MKGIFSSKSQLVLGLAKSLLVAFLLAACSEPGVAPENPLKASEPDVYTAGWEGVQNSSFAVATYWKNGVPVHLTDGTQWAEANSIVVSGNNVYVAGYEGTTATYWKNGVAVHLTDGSPSGAEAHSIVVSGNDIYVAGTVPSNKLVNWDHSVAVYWINGIQVNLTHDTVSSAAFSIAVSGNDIYVAGNADNKIYAAGNKHNKPHYDAATYWKNGVAIRLTDGLTDTIPSFATAIVVSGSDVFACGVQGDPGDPTFAQAKYWKNGVVAELMDNVSHSVYASDIAVSGNDVYVSGWSTDQLTKAIYWKNGIPVPLSSSPVSGGVNSIAVSGNDVYAAGNLFYGAYGARPGSAAKYWKNGSPAMTIDSVSGAYIKSIYLVNK
jgi:hypothetical protein